MKFSVVIPCYKVEEYLSACLDSLLAQTYRDWEAVIIDDGSPDKSGDIADFYAKNDARFKVIHTTNGGLSAARNIGIDNTCGDYILFLDSDDWLEPCALQILFNNIDDEEMICFSGRHYFEDYKQFDNPDVLLEKKYAIGWDYYNENANQHREFQFVCVVLRIYKREMLLKNNVRFEEGIYHEDNMFTPLVCYYAGETKVINRSLYVYRIRQGSTMGTNHVKRMFDLIYIANKLSETFINTSCEHKTIYGALSCYYQKVFNVSTTIYDKQCSKKINWKSYKIVSRTKFRHRVFFLMTKYTPELFRWFIKHI